MGDCFAGECLLKAINGFVYWLVKELYHIPTLNATKFLFCCVRFVYWYL